MTGARADEERRWIAALPAAGPARERLRAVYREDETAAVARILAAADLPQDLRARAETTAAALVEAVRRSRVHEDGLDAFLHEYALSSEEGVVLMCLAEALLRVPDAETADDLIRDKLAPAKWERHLGASESLFVNASTWALMVSGRLIRMGERPAGDFTSVFTRLLARSGEPVIRQAVIRAMRVLGRQFVMGRSIGEALKRAAPDVEAGVRHSYDMLGEQALTAADARRYFDAYAGAIAAIGRAGAGRGPIEGPGLSVKLSALHPRFELAQTDRLQRDLVPRLVELARLARDAGIGLTVDAEEADRLDPSLDLIAAVAADSGLKDWDGFGLAMQAYQKRALPLIDWLRDLADGTGRRLMVRLVKGAYWDSEIKRAQENGLAGYPVFTRKVGTDVSYLACAQRLLAARQAIFPAFATHNALTLATVLELAGGRRDLEFQRLHGMGEPLYGPALREAGIDLACRVYAPVGSHEDLLPYLVRRLLENGANSSFVNRIADEDLPVTRIVADPVARLDRLEHRAHPHIPLPAELFGAERRNARGIDLSDPAALRTLATAMAEVGGRRWYAAPLLAGRAVSVAPTRPVREPADRRRIVGDVLDAEAGAVGEALEAAVAAAPGWDATPAGERAAPLERLADSLETSTPALLSLLVREAGKTLPDAVAEIREAVDFCRYYAMQGRALFGAPRRLPGPTGETNSLALHGRGVFACISPWNFPLAIMLGQVAAALAAGNAVIAKPAEQTPLIAAEAVRLAHAAGVPAAVLQLLPGDGKVGGALTADPRLGGVAFTGSIATAQAINRTLAAREGAIIPLIAETGGVNAMIVDSSALPEQVVQDAVTSAFRSAGQRCSALRVLFVQEDVAPRVLRMLAGAMAERAMGDPAALATDIGPVIDDAARDGLEAHRARMRREAKVLFEGRVPEACTHGTYVPPCAYEVDSLERIGGEVFGPILHVIRFPLGRLDAVVDAINRAGYGLTVGLHSRIDSRIADLHSRLRVGNTYVNRNQIGAVVGVQPFGGEGLSGTGPKAGGPYTLLRFAVERSLSVNTTAQGGNATLLSLPEEA